jgi:hypothetical protein
MNREKNLLKVLPSWLNTSANEIIIIDWSSSTPLAPSLNSFKDPRLKIIRIDDEKSWILTHAFNVGLRAASFESIFKFDCDIEIEKDFFNKNQFSQGEFVRGFWKLAVDLNKPDQKYVNGTFGAFKNDLRLAGYYDERILTYGWDDSDIYSRLAMDLGLSAKLIDPESLKHIEQEEVQRTENQEISKNLFLGKFQPTEFEGSKNKYLTLNNASWGNYQPGQDYKLTFENSNLIAGKRSTIPMYPSEDMLSLASKLGARQLCLWNAAELTKIPFELQKSLAFSQLFSDAHKVGLSGKLFKFLQSGQGLHFLLCHEPELKLAIIKTIHVLKNHDANFLDKILIIESNHHEPEKDSSNIPYLTAPAFLIAELAFAINASNHEDIAGIEARIANGLKNSTLTKISLASIQKEVIFKSDLFRKDLSKTYEMSTASIPKTSMVTSLYDEFNLIRLIEYLACLVINLSIFQKIVIFYESNNNLFYSLFRIIIKKLNIESGRLIILPFDLRPKFEDLFSVQDLFEQGTLLAVINADIVFDRSLDLLAAMDLKDVVTILSRRDVSSDGKTSKLIRLENGSPNTFSADAWIVRTPFKPDFYLDYQIGTMHCDSFINNQVGLSKKYKAINPCLDVKIYHLHDERFNSSLEKSIKEKKVIEERYGVERERNQNNDPVKGIGWTSTKTSLKVNWLTNLQQWRPKTFIFDTSSHEFNFCDLVLLHLIRSSVESAKDLVIVLRVRHEEVGGIASEILAQYQAYFKTDNFIVDLKDSDFDRKLAESIMSFTKDVNFALMHSWVKEGVLEKIKQHVIDLTQWPGIEGAKMVRGDFVSKASTYSQLLLLHDLYKLIPKCGEEISAFISSIGDWDAKTALKPFASLRDDILEYGVNIPETKTPRISFVTSLFKGGDFLRGYLENISLSAALADGEIIIVDANPDTTDELVIKKFIEENKVFSNRIKYIHLEKDPGLYKCWNIGIENSSGAYITNANIDDRRDPYHTLKLINFLDKNEKYAGVCGDLSAVDSGSLENYFSIIRNQIWFNDIENGDVTKNDFFVKNKDEISSRNIMHCMPIWRKSLHDKYGYFDEDTFGTSADWEFWLRCSEAREIFYHLTNSFGIYFINPNSHNRRDIASIAKESEIIKKYF